MVIEGCEKSSLRMFVNCSLTQKTCIFISNGNRSWWKTLKEAEDFYDNTPQTSKMRLEQPLQQQQKRLENVNAFKLTNSASDAGTANLLRQCLILARHADEQLSVRCAAVFTVFRTRRLRVQQAAGARRETQTQLREGRERRSDNWQAYQLLFSKR